MSGGDHRISEPSTVCLCPDLRKKKTPTTTTPSNDSFHKTFRGSEQWGAAWSAIVMYIYNTHYTHADCHVHLSKRHLFTCQSRSQKVDSLREIVSIGLFRPARSLSTALCVWRRKSTTWKLPGRFDKRDVRPSSPLPTLQVDFLSLGSMYDIFTYICHENQPNVGWIHHTWMVWVW